jgi:hypothetical protein
MKTIIHVNQHIIKANKKLGTKEAPLTAKSYKGNVKANGFQIRHSDGTVIATFRYQPENPLDCGAHVWCETEFEVVPI